MSAIIGFLTEHVGSFISSSALWPAVSAVVIAFVLKVVNRNKLWFVIKPSAVIVAVAINSLLLRFLPKKSVDAVENGLILTIVWLGKEWLSEVERKILEFVNGAIIIQEVKIATKEKERDSRR